MYYLREETAIGALLEKFLEDGKGMPDNIRRDIKFIADPATKAAAFVLARQDDAEAPKIETVFYDACIFNLVEEGIAHGFKEGFKTAIRLMCYGMKE